MTELLSLALFVLVGSGLCSCTEAALFSVPMVRARQLAEERPNSRRARLLLGIRERMGRPIATIVILNNVFNIVGSIAVGSVASRVLGDHWLGVFSGVLTFLVIIFGEIIPKTLGERYAERIGLLASGPIAALTLLLTPLVALVELTTRPLVSGPRLSTTNEAEIRLLAHIGHEEGSIEEDELEMIQRVFLLNDRSAMELMTPRVRLSAVWADDLIHEAVVYARQCPHTRIVVYGENVDDVRGIVMRSDLLAAMLDGHGQAPVAKLVRPVQRVPETVPADKLLQTFQKSRQHLAVVVNEYGGTSGVVTLEDVLEVITGEIVDETDMVADLQEDARRQGRTLIEASSGDDNPHGEPD